MIGGKLVRDIISHRDPRSSSGYRFDEVKISGVIAVVFSCWMVGYRVLYLNDQFDAYSFLLGMAALLVAMTGGPVIRDRWGGGADRDRDPSPPPSVGRQL